MILKKPYGLMIKHFRIIHLILTVFAIYVMSASKTTVSFFRDYVANDYKASVVEHMANMYINPFIYVILFLMFVILVGLIVLLRYKEKPYMFYLYTIIYYAFFFIMLLVAANLLTGLEKEVWVARNARIYSDISLFVYLPQIIFIVVLLTRTLGFDVKKFDFQKDIAELELSDTDSEEVEINLGFETYKAERTIRRFIRETTYYAKENKLIILCALAFLTVIFGYVFIKNYEVTKFTYRQNKKFDYNGFTIKVEDSMITNLDASGDIIDDNYYCVLRVTLTNNNLDSRIFDYSNFLLYRGSHRFSPQLSIGNKFIDYAEDYHGQKIAPSATKTYVFAYKIDKTKANYKIMIYKGLSKKYKSKTIIVKLNPLIINNVDTIQTKGMNDVIDLNGTYLDNSSITIKDYQIVDRYTYQYESCSKDKCYTVTDIVTPKFKKGRENILLVLDYDYTIDSNSLYYKTYQSINTFIDNFFKIQYAINNGIVTANITNVTPQNVNDKIILQVDSDVKNADIINVLITVRNSRYIINLK